MLSNNEVMPPKPCTLHDELAPSRESETLRTAASRLRPRDTLHRIPKPRASSF